MGSDRRRSGGDGADMEKSYETVEGTVLVYDDLADIQADRFVEVCRDLVARYDLVSFDLTRAKRISSITLGLIVSTHIHASGRGRKVAVRVPSRFAGIFEASGVSTLIPTEIV